jgi:hypothetical protein
MPSDETLADFIRVSFRSIWALELLIALKHSPGGCASREELVSKLCASDAVVTLALEHLLAGGLVIIGKEDKACFAPASPGLARLFDRTEELYARKPDAVRRLIISAPASGATAFANAFRWRKD